MGHHAQYVACLIDDTSNMVKRTIEIGFLGELALLIAVAKDNLIFPFELAQHLRRSVEISVKMGDGNIQYLVFSSCPAEGGFVVLNPDIDVLAEKLQIFVSQHGTG